METRSIVSVTDHSASLLSFIMTIAVSPVRTAFGKASHSTEKET